MSQFEKGLLRKSREWWKNALLMAVLLNVHQISKSFSGKTLFSGISFGLETGQRIGLIGPNGAGKSTLLKILAGQEKPEEGQVTLSRGLRLGYLKQSPQFQDGETVFEAILSGSEDPYEPETLGLASELVSRLELDGSEAGESRLVAELSGGWKKRVALARELIKRPDLLLLDEPTNHLDLLSILWLEKYLLQNSNMALLMVTHDRLFLQKTCDIIFDLDPKNPDGLLKFTGPYAEFLDYKTTTMEAMQKLEAQRKNYLRQETAWLRRGSIARQTKQQARIDRAGDLKDEVDALKTKNRDNRIDVEFAELGRSPKRMIEAKNISKKAGDRYLFKDFSILIGPKTRLGLVGKNGSGKTTLIRTLIGQIQVDSGTVIMNEDIKVAYFEQQKQELQQDVSVLKSICPEGDYVHVQGKPIFAKSYLHRFNFRGEQMDLPVSRLSGGEQSRLMIAKLMMQTEPILVLDEPTNDLDIATLDVLEESLRDFPGAVILVTHDRYFMDQVANRILGLTDRDGEVLQFADFFQWEEWYNSEGSKSKAKVAGKDSAAKSGGKTKLGYKDQRELDTMESTIQDAEKKVAELEQKLAQPEIQSDFAKLQELGQELSQAQARVEKLYERWQELSATTGSNQK